MAVGGLAGECAVPKQLTDGMRHIPSSVEDTSMQAAPGYQQQTLEEIWILQISISASLGK